MYTDTSPRFWNDETDSTCPNWDNIVDSCTSGPVREEEEEFPDYEFVRRLKQYQRALCKNYPKLQTQYSYQIYNPRFRFQMRNSHLKHRQIARRSRWNRIFTRRKNGTN